MSDLPIRTYIRRPEPVEAVQVTEENIEAVAEWCGIDGHHRRQSLPSRIGEMALMGHDGRMAGFWPAGLFEQVYQEQPAADHITRSWHDCPGALH